MNRRAKEILWEYGVPLLSISILLFSAVLVKMCADRFECNRYSETTQRETKYVAWSGCYVNLNGTFVHRNELRTHEYTHGF